MVPRAEANEILIKHAPNMAPLTYVNVGTGHITPRSELEIACPRFDTCVAIECVTLMQPTLPSSAASPPTLHLSQKLQHRTAMGAPPD